ncbi:putative uncharacterized protein [Clostridium sp. CAG:1013]|nr:putative uncharacterized protein [Clostridium sp. CAG:1013]
MKKLISLLLALCLIVGMVPVVSLAATPDTISLAQFVEEVEKAGYNYDGGNNVVVEIAPSSGCDRTTTSGHESHVVKGENTPDRIQNYSGTSYAQYQRFKESDGVSKNISISNVSFKLITPDEDIKVCGAWNTTQTTASKDKLDAELQLMNSGSVSFTNCTFENVAVSPINSSNVTFTDCNFSGLAGYAIKDVGAATVSISSNEFANCSGGVYLNSGGTTTTTFTGNSFVDMGERGAIQFSANGDYQHANISLVNNSYESAQGETSGGFLRLLNATLPQNVFSSLEANNTGITEWYTSDSIPSDSQLQPGTNFTGKNTVFDGTDYYESLVAALNAIHKQSGKNTLWCKPGADVGEMTHGHVCSDLTIYGNGAYVSGGERDFELDTYDNIKPGKEGSDLTGDVTLKVYNLNGAAAWGERHSSHTINIYMEGCQNMNRVYFTGTSGTNNITLKNCTFDGTDNSAEPWKKANSCTVYSNAPGLISVEKCDFSNIMAPVNLNNKAAKGTKQNITVKDCTFTDCSTVYNETEKLYAAPIRVLSTAGADSSLTVDTCSFTYSTGKSSANGDILLGEGRVNELFSYPVEATITNTEAEVQVQNPGDRTNEGNNGAVVNVTASSQPTYVSNYEAQIGDVKYMTLEEAIQAAKSGDTVTLVKDVILSSQAGDTKGALTITENITLDGNGKTISANTAVNEFKEKTSMINIQGGAKVTVKDLTIDSKKIAKHGLNITSAAGENTTVTVENVTVQDGTGYGVVCNTSTLVVNGLTTSGNAWGGVNVDTKLDKGTSTVTINNADIKEQNSLYIENAKAENGGSSNTTINGGTFAGQVSIQDANGEDVDSAKLVINAGKFSPSVDITDYLAPGKVLNPDGTVGGSDNPPVTTPTYTPTITKTENGKVTVSPASPKEGDEVTITATPEEGYKVGTVTVEDASGHTLKVTNIGSGKYTFEQPDSKVVITVTFVWDSPFVDVGDKWYTEAVQYVYENGLMAGTSGTTFDPETKMNRAMAVQILYNLEGQPTVNSEATFTDADAAGAWAVNAIAWAESTGVVAGYGDGTFLPKKLVSREEFAQIMYNYAVYKQLDTTAAADLTKFPDSGNVHSWAETAMEWANGNELINGHDNGMLDPQGTTTRAQAASILMKFDLNLVK